MIKQNKNNGKRRKDMNGVSRLNVGRDGMGVREMLRWILGSRQME